MKKKFLFTIVLFTVLFVVDKIYFNTEIESIKEDLSIINIAGSQRMACQKIVKNVLYYEINQPAVFTNAISLENNLNAFKRSHIELTKIKTDKYKNNKNLQSLFAELEPHYKNIYESGKALVNNQKSVAENLPYIRAIKLNDYDYLNIMDRVVKEYELIGKERITKIKSRENIFNTMVILLFLNIIGVTAFKLYMRSKKKKEVLKVRKLEKYRKKAVEDLVYN